MANSQKEYYAGLKSLVEDVSSCYFIHDAIRRLIDELVDIPQEDANFKNMQVTI